MHREHLACLLCAFCILSCEVGSTSQPPPREERGPEGTRPGECSDGADNDANKLFDCKDPACAEAPACSQAHEPGPVISRHTYKEGYARWVNRIDLPNTIWEVKGQLTVTVFDNYVKVDKDGGDAVWYVPRERLIYAGREVQ